MNSTSSPTHLVIGVPFDPPFANPCAVTTLSATRLCPTPGLDAEIVASIFDEMDVTYSLVNLTSTVWGSESTNRSLWTGMKRLLLDGDVDFISGFFFSNRNREEYFDMTFPIMQAGSTFVVRSPKTSFWSAALLVVRVYSLEIWSLFLGTILLMLAFVFAYRRVDPREGGERPPLWEYVRFILPEESYDKIREGTYAANLLILIMGFALILVVSLYQGSLLTVLLYPPPTQAFTRMDELVAMVANRDLTIVVDYEGQWFHEMVKTSEDDNFQRLRHAVRHNPIMFRRENFSNSVPIVMEQIKTGRLAYFSLTEVDAVFLMSEYDKECELQMVPAPELPRPRFQYMFNKGHWAVDPFNEATLKRLQQIDLLRDKYLKRTIGCQSPTTGKRHVTTVQPLGLLPLTGLLLLFAGGCLLAISWFVYERVDWRQLFARNQCGASPTPPRRSVTWQLEETFNHVVLDHVGEADRLDNSLY